MGVAGQEEGKDGTEMALIVKTYYFNIWYSLMYMSCKSYNDLRS